MPGATILSRVCASELTAPCAAIRRWNGRKAERKAPARREQAGHEPARRRVVGGARVHPARVALGLLGGLLHVGGQALGQRLERLVGVPGGPGAHQGLVEQVLVVGVGRGAAVHVHLEAAGEGPPAPDLGGPGGGDLGEHVDARAHVLAALGVVGRGGDEGLRPPVQTRRVLVVEDGGRFAVARGISADLVERDEAVVDVERGVLDALGGDRPGRLLEAHREVPAGGQVVGIRAGRVPHQEDVAKEVEDRDVHGGVAALGLRDRFLDVRRGRGRSGPARRRPRRCGRPRMRRPPRGSRGPGS